MKYILLIIVATLLASCSSAGAEVNTLTKVNTLTSQEAYELVTGDTEIIILDVRSEEEFRSGHIAYSISLPVDEISERAEAMLPDKDAMILVICRSGVRSQVASQELVDLGFTNVYDIGGIMSWPGELID